MLEFFRGWRRKTGVVTLVMALVLMTGWVRSFHFCDLLWIQSPWGSHFVYSECGHFRAWVFSGRRFATICGWVLSQPGEWMHDGNSVPYGPIVIPLTLLSAYLILWKPRKPV